VREIFKTYHSDYKISTDQAIEDLCSAVDGLKKTEKVKDPSSSTDFAEILYLKQKEGFIEELDK
jgi:hypothetical protein